MTRYYISANNEKGFEEITEAEWNAIIGQTPNSTYANKVYRGTMSIDEVPEENRETVQAIVDAKIAKWGLYENQTISSNELQNLIEEVL